MNVQCTRKIVKLLTGCRHLESFVHVSTAFVNSHNHCDVIEEKIYRRKVDLRNFEKSLKFLNDEQLAGMLPQLLDGLLVLFLVSLILYFYFIINFCLLNYTIKFKNNLKLFY